MGDKSPRSKNKNEKQGKSKKAKAQAKMNKKQGSLAGTPSKKN